jgi:hypothetical protein
MGFDKIASHPLAMAARDSAGTYCGLPPRGSLEEIP